MKASGYDLFSSAILDREHEQMIGSRTIKDLETRATYVEYGPGIIDVETGIALPPFDATAADYPDICIIGGQSYLPARRLSPRGTDTGRCVRRQRPVESARA